MESQGKRNLKFGVLGAAIGGLATRSWAGAGIGALSGVAASELFKGGKRRKSPRRHRISPKGKSPKRSRKHRKHPSRT
jgi:hypothetical protein